MSFPTIDTGGFKYGEVRQPPPPPTLADFKQAIDEVTRVALAYGLSIQDLSTALQEEAVSIQTPE